MLMPIIEAIASMSMLNWLLMSNISCSVVYSVPVSLVSDNIVRIISKSMRICSVALLDGSDSSRIVASILSIMTEVISANSESPSSEELL